MSVKCSLCGKDGGHPEGRCPELTKLTSKSSATNEPKNSLKSERVRESSNPCLPRVEYNYYTGMTFKVSN